ncbi:hypothetical protein FBZ83_11526 [Azospirillum brasilense]|uniref:Uncharacterized protein n=1 Tax=Azospirillum brasilense TaxID=192 RepID=A0A560BY63_AZOBR|nr:hypothetical protein [Azospirillum brasilense]TWA77548.1 hypothetical protein FBZ83_11526 [Azospirillum brasilense]
MPITARTAALVIAAGLCAATPARAADPAPGTGPLCSPTVSAALTSWDMGLQAAGTFGDRAVALAKEKGREYILPLLGIDPAGSPPGAEDGTSAIGRLLELSRQDPQQRLDLCMAITGAVESAKGSTAAGLEALKRALDGVARPAPAEKPAEKPADGQIRI